METKAWPSQQDSGALAPPDGLCTGKACDCGRVPCGMYLFDHRQGDHKVCTGWGGCMTLREWFVHNLTVSEMGLLNPAIDGFFIDDNWSSKLMGDGADGTGDLNGSDVSDCGLSPTDMKDMKQSWISNMNTVKAAILDNHGFIWQMMVNNGTGTSSIVHKGATCAKTLRAACKADSVEQRGALNYGVQRGTAQQPDALQLRAEPCAAAGEAAAAAAQKWNQPHGNGGTLQHAASGKCVTVAGSLNDLDLAPCEPPSDGSSTQNWTFSSGSGLVYSGSSQTACWDLQVSPTSHFPLKMERIDFAVEFRCV